MILAQSKSQQPVRVTAAEPQANASYASLEQWAGFTQSDASQRKQMPQLIIDIALTRDGRDMKDAEHHEFAHNVNGATDVATATSKALKYGNLLARIAPNSIAFVRASVSEYSDLGKIIHGSSYSIPLDLNGLFAVPNGVKLAPRGNVLRYEKLCTVKGRTGRFDIRGFLTAPELAQFLADKTLPARFLAAGTTADAPGTFLEAFMAAATDGPLKLAMPSIKVDNNLVLRPVTSIRLAGAKTTRASRTKKSVKRKLIDATQEQVNDWGKEAQFVRDNAPFGPLSAAEQAKITALRALADAAINKLDVSYKSRVKMPLSLQ